MANPVLLERHPAGGSGMVVNSAAFLSDECIDVNFVQGDGSDGPSTLDVNFKGGRSRHYSGQAAEILWTAVKEAVKNAAPSREEEKKKS